MRVHFVAFDEVHVWTNLYPMRYFTPAGGETATTQMGDTDHGNHRSTEANPSNPFTTAFTVTPDPGNPWRAIARALGAKPDAGKGTRESELEVVETDMPILATRMAALRFAGDGKHWAAVVKGTAFGVDTVAVCNGGSSGLFGGVYFGDPAVMGEPHKVPHPDCTCGFYGVPLGKNDYTTDRQYVRLLVELAGDVIECEYLYRAEHQRVIECQLPRCKYCGKPSEVALAKDGTAVQFACAERHLERSKKGIRLGLDELAELLPVPIVAMEPR